MAGKKEKPLTLEGLARYNQEVLFPFMEERFVTKDDIKNFTTKKDFGEFKDDMIKFKDEALQKLGTLTQEKTIGDAQDKRQKKVLEIHNEALKNSEILSEKQVSEIDKLRIF